MKEKIKNFFKKFKIKKLKDIKKETESKEIKVYSGKDLWD